MVQGQVADGMSPACHIPQWYWTQQQVIVEGLVNPVYGVVNKRS